MKESLDWSQEDIVSTETKGATEDELAPIMYVYTIYLPLECDFIGTASATGNLNTYRYSPGKHGGIHLR